MSSVTSSEQHPVLRRDLNSLKCRGRRRAYRIVVDEVSGRFARVSEHLWQSLQAGTADASLWRQADAAGWTRRRNQTAGPSLNLLYIRQSLGSVDSLAVRLIPWTGWLFAPPAVAIWSAVIVLALLLAISRSGDLVVSLGSLQLFFTQSNPVWLGLIFVATKVVHEFGHAIVCRRVGSRCGTVGILFLCGMPCPYCDVTDVWRQGSTAKRAAVMLAGIYVELILAALATFTWLLATDPMIRLHAMNLMVVCGISTLIFNANPLMRYDGYYVLSDLLGSTNLRQEARDTFQGVVIKPIAGPSYAVASQTGSRSIGLAFYHVASIAYRIVVLSAIAALFLAIAQHFQVRRIAVLALIGMVLVVAARFARRTARVVGGGGPWSLVSKRRRGGIVFGILLLVAFVLFLPLPRYRMVAGWIDAANTSSVYLSQAGMIGHVGFEFGDPVRKGDLLARVENDALELQQTKLQGKLRLASLRRDLSRRVSLDRTDMAGQWSTLQAAEQAVSQQLASVSQRIEKANVRAPLDGIILPPAPTIDSEQPGSVSLLRRTGTAAAAYQSWCRISPDGAIEAVLILDARDRINLDTGSPVNISVTALPAAVHATKIHSVSAIKQETESVTRRSEYQVLCRLPAVDRTEVIAWLGRECKAVFHLPHRSLASDIARWFQSWIDGELS